MDFSKLKDFLKVSILHMWLYLINANNQHVYLITGL